MLLFALPLFKLDFIYPDPAYPPSRQIIYLRVAQPRGLIVLKGAGKINPSVREFLNAELKIRVEVPALKVFPTGVIQGGAETNGSDVLGSLTHLADTDPNVALGPDSIGTLSFTSGSTGIPKGVRGRHFSLTHFFPWMGERFGLGPDAKFTMLSGIAHDPIQRDSECDYSRFIFLKVDDSSVHASLLGCRVTYTNVR